MVPDSVSGLKVLEELDLSSTKLEGPWPRQVCRGLGKLKRLWLADTSLSGPVVEELGGLRSLRYLSLDRTDFTG